MNLNFPSSTIWPTHVKRTASDFNPAKTSLRKW